MSATSAAQALLMALSASEVDPSFGKLWWSLPDTLRHSVANLALSYCSARVQAPSQFAGDKPVAIVLPDFYLDSPVACAILNLYWQVDGSIIKAYDLMTMDGHVDGRVIAEYRIDLARELEDQGPAAAVALKAYLEKCAAEADCG